MFCFNFKWASGIFFCDVNDWFGGGFFYLMVTL